MNHLLYLCCLLACQAAVAASPSQAIIQTCLKGNPTQKSPTATEVPTGEVYKEDNYLPGLEAVFLIEKNQMELGYIKGKSGDAILFNKKIFQLNEARVAAGPLMPHEFEPYTATWLLITNQESRFLCVSFNFEGIGQSGRFQSIRGGYLIDARKKSKTLYFATGDISKF
ncbi:hypothetical protein [Azohydromonas lata]|uniref:hypothetical protein n=1 Tax=Azohydromonas lata TaxID=45677 RepID=UPI0012F4A356|nr:hypothetical protein [Azohydromonas lata]